MLSLKMIVKEGDNCNCIDHPKSIFNGLKEEEKNFLRQNHICIRYKKDDLIFKEGDKPTGLICLSEGKVKIFKEGVGGREQIVRLARPVGFIGYRALFAGENYLASAQALENSTVCSIEAKALFEVVKNNSAFALQIIQSLASELGLANSRCVTLTQKHVRGRLAEAILILIDTYGFEDDNATIKAYLSREDLASLCNMTASNAIRTLSNFAKEKLIDIKRRRIRVLDLHLLEKISEQG